jgi:hypothetical protein
MHDTADQRKQVVCDNGLVMCWWYVWTKEAGISIL